MHGGGCTVVLSSALRYISSVFSSVASEARHSTCSLLESNFDEPQKRAFFSSRSCETCVGARIDGRTRRHHASALSVVLKVLGVEAL